MNLNRLESSFNAIGIKKTSFLRATQQEFLSPWEKMFTNMYSYGTYKREKNTETEISYDILSSIQLQSKLVEEDNKLALYENKQENIISTNKNMTNLINFNSDQVINSDQFEDDNEEFEVDLTKISSPRANLINSPRNINILPIVNTLVNIEETSYQDDELTEAVSRIIRTIGKSQSPRNEKVGGTPITFDRSLPINSKLIPNYIPVESNEIIGSNLPPTVFDLLTDESKELLAINKINEEVVEEFKMDKLVEDILPFIDVISDLDDDKIQPVFENIVKISTISGPNGFFHGMLKSFYPKYNEISGIEYRESLVKDFKRELAQILTYKDENDPRQTYYDVLVQIAKELSPDNEILSLQVYKDLLESDANVGSDIFKFCSYILNIDIYFVLVYPQDIRIHFRASFDKDVPGIILYGLDQNFEPVGVIQDGLIQTVFYRSDPFLQNLLTS